MMMLRFARCLAAITLCPILVGCSIDASIFSNQNTALPSLPPSPPSFNISAAPKEVPENFPYLADLSLQNTAGSVTYSLDSNTCENLTLNTSTGQVRGVLGHTNTQSCTYSVKANVDGIEDYLSDPITLNFIPSLSISFSTATEKLKIADIAKTVQIEFNPAPPFDSYLPFEIVSFSGRELNLIDGFADKGEIPIQGGNLEQALSLEVSSSTAILPTAEYQSLYITAGSSISRPQLDLAILQNDSASIVDLSINRNGGACAVTSLGKLYCWGWSSGGALGSGSSVENLVRPQQVGTGTVWQMVDMNNGSSCGILNGELFCWGTNTSGQLGTGNTNSGFFSPSKVGTATNWTYVSINSTACGIRSGELYCWGNNQYGTVGAGSTGGNILPITKIGTLSNWQMIAIGESHTCGIEGGNLYCWGSNDTNKLGIGTNTGIFNTPQLVNSGGWTHVTTGTYHSCGIKEAKLFCWGNNAFGQSFVLGTTPTQVGSDTNWTWVSSSERTTCGIRSGSLYCWGTISFATIDGIQLIDNSVGWTKIKSMRDGYGCGLKNDYVFCFSDLGGFGTGALGNGKATGVQTTPLKLGSSSWSLISRGDRLNCGIQNGELYCWGTNNVRGQLGNGIVALAENLPRRIGSKNDWTHVSIEQNYAAGIRGGQLYWWGYDSVLDENVALPTRIGTSTNWTQISVSSKICGIESGRLFCWSSGANPLQVGSSTTWTHIAVGSNHQCGIDSGKLYCWGENNFGQIGLGTITSTITTPTQIGTATNWTHISASRHPGTFGYDHTCGILGGSPYCWGKNYLGQNGNGTSSGNATSPVQISGLPGWTKIEASAGNACGIQNGHMFCWGTNSDGQIGSGASLSNFFSTPVQVGSDNTWTNLSVFQDGVLAIKENALFGWGVGTQFKLNKDAPYTILDFY